MLKVNIETGTCLPIHQVLKGWLHTEWQNPIRLINFVDIKHLCECCQAMLLRKTLCIPVSVLEWGGSVLVFVCDSVKCVCIFVCLFACLAPMCVDLCRCRRTSSKFRDAGLISCGSGSGECSFLGYLPAGSSSSPLMGLLGVDALFAGCQKVKVPYSSGTLQSLCRFEAYCIVTHLSLLAGGEQA